MIKTLLFVTLAGSLLVVPSALAYPSSTPPTATSPPPAWISTSRGDYWLSTFGGCLDTPGPTPAACPTPALPSPMSPRLSLTRGETVRLHFGFVPAATVGLRVPLTVSAFPEGGRSYRLSPFAPLWRVRGDSGIALVSALSAQNIPASYVAGFQIADSPKCGAWLARRSSLAKAVRRYRALAVDASTSKARARARNSAIRLEGWRVGVSGRIRIGCS